MQSYTYEEALAETIKYFNGDDLAAKVWLDKYALYDNEDNLLELTPTDMHKRLAKEFARIEQNKFKHPLSYDEIFAMFDRFKRIIPQGSPMYGVGNKYKYISLSNCFVISPPYDSYSGIMHTDAEMVALSSRRGGVGTDISKLRPKNMLVKNSAKTTTGAVSFMERFSNTIREVGQNARRGALLLSISVRHPDIFDFIRIKRDLTKVTGSNITVQFCDEFMKAVENNQEFILQWPVCKEHADEMKLPFPVVSKTVKAKDIWDEFIIGARDFAEPGACFIDTVHRESTCYHHGMQEVSSNPCGEQYLPPNSSCRLIVILLLSYVKKPFTSEAEFDFESFYQDCYHMQRLADDMVDLEIEAINRIIEKIENDHEPEHIKQTALDLWRNIRRTSFKDRRTGCGFTGLGDTIAALNMKYGSEASIQFAEQMQQTFKYAVYQSSVDMAEELGPFEGWTGIENDLKSTFIQRLKHDNPGLVKKMAKYGRRNSVLMTIAPTGSVSCLTQTTSGIEPVFELEYMRRKKINPGDINAKIDFVDPKGDKWQMFKVNHKGLQDWINITKESDIKLSPYYGATANEIDWIAKTRLQGVLQRHIDNSISVTTNLPSDVSYEVVSQIYLHSWRNGAKGCTVYRDGCRTGVLIKNEQSNKVKERPKELQCDVHHATIKGVQYFILVGKLDDKPYEVFAGKNGFLPRDISCGRIIKKRNNFYKAEFDGSDIELAPVTAVMEEHEEIISRLTSALLRSGADMHLIVKQLEKVGERQDIHSFARCISRILKKYIPDGTLENEPCPDCGHGLIRQEGCKTCLNCGYSKCS